MANNDIRAAAKEAGVRLWQVAEELGMADCVLSRKMRHEFSTEQKVEAMAAISRLAKGAGQCG